MRLRAPNRLSASPDKRADREEQQERQRRVRADVEGGVARGVVPRQRAKAVGQINRLAGRDGEQGGQRGTADANGDHARLVELVDVLGRPVVEPKVARVGGEDDHRVAEIGVDRLHRHAVAYRAWVQRGLEAHLLARGHVGHLHDAGGGVERVLGDEDHGAGEGDVAVGIREGEIRRVAVSLQVDVGVANAERAVDTDRRLGAAPCLAR